MMRKIIPLLQEIERANREHKLFEKMDTLLLAVSGGPDSMALLALFSKLRRKYGLRLFAAHLHHGLSATEGRRYQVLVRRWCRLLDVPLFSKRVAIRSLAKKNKRSIEDMGRIERYRFFERKARQLGHAKIVTAHTLDEQAETVLMRLIRGAGLRGLSGIPFKRRQGEVEVLRPLLYCRKADLVAFLRENHIPFCRDKSNADTVFMRNRVRRKLMPLLEAQFNPSVKESLSNLQQVARDAQQYLEGVAARAFKKYAYARSPRSLTFPVLALKRLPPAVQREVFSKAIQEMRGDLKRIRFDHLCALQQLLVSRDPRAEAELPGSLRVRKSPQTLEFIDTPGK